MNNEPANSVRRRFVASVLLVDAGLLAMVAMGAWSLNLSFGLCLLMVGAAVGGIGLFLGSPDTSDPDNPRNLPFAYIFTPNKKLEDQETYDEEHTVPTYAFENVLLYAGFVAVLVSLPFVAYAIFAK